MGLNKSTNRISVDQFNIGPREEPKETDAVGDVQQVSAITEDYLNGIFARFNTAMEKDFERDNGRAMALHVISMTPFLDHFPTVQIDSLNYRVGVALKAIFEKDSNEYFRVRPYIEGMLKGNTAKQLIEQDKHNKFTTNHDNSQDLKGGIDFAQSNLDMQIKRDGAGVVLPVSQQNLENIRIDGLVPEILSIQPVGTSLLQGLITP